MENLSVQQVLILLGICLLWTACGVAPTGQKSVPNEAIFILGKESKYQADSHLTAELADFRLPDGFRGFFGCKKVQSKTQCSFEFFEPNGKRSELKFKLPSGSFFSNPKSTEKNRKNENSSSDVVLSNSLFLARQNIHIKTESRIGELFIDEKNKLRFRICSGKFQKACKIQYNLNQKNILLEEVYSQKLTIRFSKKLSKYPLQIEYHSTDQHPDPLLHIGFDTTVKGSLFPAGSEITAIEFNDGAIFKGSDLENIQLNKTSLVKHPLIKKLENCTIKNSGSMTLHLNLDVLSQSQNSISMHGEHIVNF